MKRFKIKNWFVTALVVLSGVLATACASYYKVMDPTSGTVYYTEKVDRGSGGAVTFTDSKSGADVTIQNSEVKEISEKEFEVGRYSAPTSKPAPVAPAPAAPTPAPAPAAPESAPAPEGK